MRQNEQSWILTGGNHRRMWWGHVSHESEGHPGSVDFPYKWVLDREEKYGDVVGFMHTHPGMIASPSPRDDATMAQWVLSFGKPLICLIEGVNGLKGYLYYSDEQPPIPIRTLKSFGQLIVGIMPKKPLACYGLATPATNMTLEEEDAQFLTELGHAIDWDSQEEFFDKPLDEMMGGKESGNK